MHFTTKFTTLAFAVIAAMVAQTAANPAPVSVKHTIWTIPLYTHSSYLQVASTVSTDEFLKWLDTTDADITYVGKPINGSVPRAAADIMVTYCTKRTQNVCGGTCTVYNGGSTCISAPGTACFSATGNVGFCDHGGCSGSCNQLSSCGTRLDNGFCSTPGTSSIIVQA
ncbi:hypothetical protein L227DRAFT_576888 [Lentinus tigrinus ALCF2SS1-6]|uniref:Uncharacterized protein n=1 Tax=Lentinus tigrinus ALCF2SS1-6 TaxID=1328759 RepID=A0A5C2S5I7_9APHY|nr:hypothetical protein L227DRAFT_576888 [Lentinus tigrinus ALCF2SS1-6]